MKKLTKIMLSVAAATVMTAAMAVTAMAADTFTGTYDNDTGVVTMDNVIGSGASQTILVYNSAAETITNADIAYINQIDNQTGPDGHFSTFTLAPGLKPNVPNTSVTYNIKIGGSDRSVQTGTLTIASDAPATVTIIIGDVDGNNVVNGTDVARIGRYLTKKATNTGSTGQIKTKPDGNTVIIGDADGKNVVNGTDVARIGRYLTKKATNTGSTGQEVEVIDEASGN